MKRVFIEGALVVVSFAALVLFSIYTINVLQNSQPTLVQGRETTTVTITLRDTVRDTIDREKIVVRQVPKIIYVYDSTASKESIIQDTSTCYSFEQTEKDGAYIRAEMCSDSLPKKKPLDLIGSIVYRGAPDTSKSTFRVDTLTRIKQTPTMKDWKTYVIAGLALITVSLLASHR